MAVPVRSDGVRGADKRFCVTAAPVMVLWVATLLAVGASCLRAALAGSVDPSTAPTTTPAAANAVAFLRVNIDLPLGVGRRGRTPTAGVTCDVRGALCSGPSK